MKKYENVEMNIWCLCSYYVMKKVEERDRQRETIINITKQKKEGKKCVVRIRVHRFRV